MQLYIKKHPNPTTLLARVYADTAPEGYEPSTEEAAAAWIEAQLNDGWEPQHAPADDTAEPRELSKLTLAERLAALGKLPAFIAVLDSNGGILRFMWDSAQSLSTAHPLFNEHAPEIKAALDLTDAQFDGLIAP
jgi:hypothetical protein